MYLSKAVMKIDSFIFKHPSSFREGRKKVHKLFAATAVTPNKLGTSHQLMIPHHNNKV